MATMGRRSGLGVRIGVAVTALVLATGCGKSDGGPGHRATAPTDTAAAWRALATCLRSHGYPTFPDPVQDRDGLWGFPASAPRTGRTACDDLGRAAKSKSRPHDVDRVNAQQLVSLRHYSECVRQHGLADWPDPGPRGTFELPTRLTGPGSSALLRPADLACKDLLKGAHVSIASGSKGNK
jgi:hypothetical protein